MPRRRRGAFGFDDFLEEIPLVGEITGADQREASRDARRARERARRARDAEMGEWNALGTAADLAYARQQRALAGIPDEAFVEGEDATAGQAAADPRAIEAQMRALSGLEDIYNQGGLTAIDRARIADAQAGQRTYEQGQRGAIDQEAQARGMGAGGTGYASALMAQQQGANRLNQQGLGIEGMAQERALSAMQAAGGLGSQARGQSFDEDFSRRQAADIGNRYNTDYARGYAGRAQESGERAAYGRAELEGDLYGRRRDVTAGKTGQYDEDAENARRREEEARAEKQRANAMLVDLGSSFARGGA